MTFLPAVVDIVRTRGQLWLRSDEDLVRRTIAVQISELEVPTHNHTLQPPDSPEKHTQKAPSQQHSNSTSEEPTVSTLDQPTNPIPIPDTSATSFFTSDNTTFAHQLALRNRIPAHNLDIGGPYDIHTHHPLFIYDILQLPSSLANVLDGDSSLDVVPSMTPGRLHKRCLHADRAGQPLLVGYDGAGGCVQGMVVFGRGVEERQRLGEHYGDEYKVEVVEVAVFLEDGVERALQAYVWVRQGEEEEKDEVVGWEDWRTWTIGGYIRGDYDDDLRDFKW